MKSTVHAWVLVNWLSCNFIHIAIRLKSSQEMNIGRTILILKIFLLVRRGRQGNVLMKLLRTTYCFNTYAKGVIIKIM